MPIAVEGGRIKLSGDVTFGEWDSFARGPASQLSFDTDRKRYILNADVDLVFGCDVSRLRRIEVEFDGHDVNGQTGVVNSQWEDVDWIETADRSWADRFPFTGLPYSAKGGSLRQAATGATANFGVKVGALEDARIGTAEQAQQDTFVVQWADESLTVDGLSASRVQQISANGGRVRVRNLVHSSRARPWGGVLAAIYGGGLMVEGYTPVALRPDFPANTVRLVGAHVTGARTLTVDGTNAAILAGSRFSVGGSTYTVEVGADAEASTTTSRDIVVTPGLAAGQADNTHLQANNTTAQDVLNTWYDGAAPTHAQYVYGLGNAADFLAGFTPFDTTRVAPKRAPLLVIVGGGVRYYQLVGGEGGVVRLSITGEEARPHKVDLANHDFLSTETETVVPASEFVEVLVPQWYADADTSWALTNYAEQTIRAWKYGKVVLMIDASGDPSAIVGAHDAAAPVLWRDDVMVTEADAAVVGAYTELDTAAKMYDAIHRYVVNERLTAMPCTRNGDELDFGALNVTLVETGDMIAVDGTTWTLNVGTEYTGNLRTTGNIDVGDVTVSGAIFDSRGDSRLIFSVPAGLNESFSIFTDKATARQDAAPFAGTRQLLMVGRAYSEMFALDRQTGVASKVGQSAVYGFEYGWPTAFAFNEANNTVYVAERESNALYEWSLLTGEITRIGSATNWGLTGGSVEMHGFELRDGVLWACGTNHIYTIDTTTGVATATNVGGTTCTDICFDGDGVLHFLTPQSVQAFSVSGTALTPVRSSHIFSSQTDATGLAYDSDTDTMYLIGRDPAALFTIEHESTNYGALTRVGSADDFGASEDRPSGITFVERLPIGRVANITSGYVWRYLQSTWEDRNIFLRLTQTDGGGEQVYEVHVPDGDGDHNISVLSSAADVTRDNILRRAITIEGLLSQDTFDRRMLDVPTTTKETYQGGGDSGGLTDAQSVALAAIRAAIHPDGGDDQIADISTRVRNRPTTDAIAVAVKAKMEADGATLADIESTVDAIESAADDIEGKVDDLPSADDVRARLERSNGVLATIWSEVVAKPSAAEVATAIMGRAVDGSVDAETALRVLLALAAGQATVSADGSTVEYLGQDGETVTLRLTLATGGNRTATAIDPPAED